MQSSIAVRGHFADLCYSNEASWGVPKLIHLYSFVTIGPVIYIYIYIYILLFFDAVSSEICLNNGFICHCRQQRRGTKLRGHTSSWNLLTVIIKSFSPLKQLLQGHRYGILLICTKFVRILELL